MLIQSIIITLGLQIIFSEKADIDCGFPNTIVVACQKDNKIILDYDQKGGDINEVLYHEIGHKLFLNDQSVKDTISKYPELRSYPKNVYTSKMKLNEKVADYFAMYIKYSDFHIKFPKLKSLFDAKFLAL